MLVRMNQAIEKAMTTTSQEAVILKRELKEKLRNTLKEGKQLQSEAEEQRKSDEDIHLLHQRATAFEKKVENLERCFKKMEEKDWEEEMGRIEEILRGKLMRLVDLGEPDEIAEKAMGRN